MERKKLSDILNNGSGETLKKTWAETKTAAEFSPLPTGEYTAHVVSGELFTAKAGTPGFKIGFKVCEGDYAGRRFWHDLWLTPAALGMTKRDLAKLGVTDPEQLEKPIPQGIRCSVKLALRKDDNGNEHNHVKTFAVVGIDAPETDPFAPADTPKGGPGQ